MALIEFLGGKCSSCLNEYHYSAYHFHHQNPDEKEFDWNRLRRRSTSEVLKEIKKCILLCSNCHGRTHAKEQVTDDVLRLKDSFLEQLRQESKVD